MTKDEILSQISKIIPSHLHGLKWTPAVDQSWINADEVGLPAVLPERHFSHCNRIHTIQYLEQCVQLHSSIHTKKCIVEIGVDRSGALEESSTYTLISNKPSDWYYIGIDLDNKSHLNDERNNVYTLQMNSSNHAELYKKLDELNIPLINFMFVDGLHSIQQVLLEWEYWDRMSAHGTMVFHDINYHPGPIALFDAIDQTAFDCFSHCESTNEVPDWGLGAVIRK